jgi:hypothetical protein
MTDRCFQGRIVFFLLFLLLLIVKALDKDGGMEPKMSPNMLVFESTASKESGGMETTIGNNDNLGRISERRDPFIQTFHTTRFPFLVDNDLGDFGLVDEASPVRLGIPEP